MVDTSTTRLNHVVPFFVLNVLCIICFSGCSESASLSTNAYLDTMASKSDFGNRSEPIPTAKTLYAVAKILAIQGKDSECEGIKKRIIREYPDFLPVYNSLAQLQMRQGRTNEAIETIHAGLRVRPKDTVLLNNLGICWLVRMEYEKALEMFTEAAGIMPENVKYRANMAVALSLMGHYEQSLSLYKQMLREDQAIYNISVIKETVKNARSVSVTNKPSFFRRAAGLIKKVFLFAMK